MVLPPTKKGLVQSLVDPHTNEWLRPKCGDRSQHIRLRWVQSKRAEAQQAPQMRDTMQRYNSMQITSKDTNRSLLETQIGTNSSLPEMQIGANNTDDSDKTPDAVFALKPLN